jgi:chromosome segregation ATPase
MKKKSEYSDFENSPVHSPDDSNLYESNFTGKGDGQKPQNVFIEDDDYELEQEREEMENDYQLVKKLTEYKEKNKRQETVIKYQKTKIDTLEDELEKALSEIRVRDMELDDLKNKGRTPNNEYKKQLSQMNSLTQQLEKYKNMYNDKKGEYNIIMEKFNELQRQTDGMGTSEKKLKADLISKDKQIAKLIDEIEKKNNVGNNNKVNLGSDKEVERLNNELKKIEKQKNDLYVAFKKSLKLCSILKRQKIHLENARLLNFTEDEFKYLIEQNKI